MIVIAFCHDKNVPSSINAFWLGCYLVMYPMIDRQRCNSNSAEFMLHECIITVYAETRRTRWTKKTKSKLNDGGYTIQWKGRGKKESLVMSIPNLCMGYSVMSTKGRMGLEWKLLFPWKAYKTEYSMKGGEIMCVYLIFWGRGIYSNSTTIGYNGL
jgi:hypothetical protein